MKREIEIKYLDGTIKTLPISKFVVVKDSKGKLGFHIEPLTDGTVRLTIGEMFDAEKQIDTIQFIRE